jgi:peptidoglycan-N-acetylglucosamine deacetylase
VDAAQSAEVTGTSPIPGKRRQASRALLAALALATLAAAAEPRLEVALTFDDLPLNGGLPPGVTQTDIARDTLAVLRKHRIPPSYGFINAAKLERSADGAQALKLWAQAGHPLANHTYTHLDLTRSSAEDFQREILRNEPALELLQLDLPGKARAAHDWRWFRYPYLHEGDTLEKRRAIRAFLERNGYRIAQTTLDHEDYLWNSAHARCVAARDDESLRWLRASYLEEAREWIRFQRELARTVFGRDIRHVLLLHLGSFSPTILPDLFGLLKEEGFDIVTLERAQSDPVYALDPDFAEPRGGTLVELMMQARGIAWPADTPSKPRERLTGICRQAAVSGRAFRRRSTNARPPTSSGNAAGTGTGEGSTMKLVSNVTRSPGVRLKLSSVEMDVNTPGPPSVRPGIPASSEPLVTQPGPLAEHDRLSANSDRTVLPSI